MLLYNNLCYGGIRDLCSESLQSLNYELCLPHATYIFAEMSERTALLLHSYDFISPRETYVLYICANSDRNLLEKII